MATALIAPLLGAVLPGLAGLFGGGKQNQINSNSTTNTNQHQNYSGTNTSTPNLNPFQEQLARMFTGGAMDMYNKSTNLAPFSTQGLQQIQGQASGNSRAISNNLASRGLSYSPAAANAMTQNTLNTGNQMNSFLQGIPLLQRQLQTSSLDELMKAFGSMPFGNTQNTSGQQDMTGTSTMQGTNVQQGNPMAGLFGGLGAGLFAPGQNGGSNLSNIIDMFKPKIGSTGNQTGSTGSGFNLGTLT